MLNLFTPSKKVKLSLVGLDGNANYLLNVFANEAKKQGWTKDEIELVLIEARKNDFNHLLKTLLAHCI